MKKVLIRLKLNKKGFTFAECIVAIALFAIVGTLAFTMFNTSARYMSKAKKEEAKLAESQEMAYKENFKNAEGKTIIYGKNVLHIEYVVTGNNQTAPSYFAQFSYTTSYGEVLHSFPISLIEEDVRYGDGGYPYRRYQVTSDVGTKRIICIYTERETNGVLE